MRAVWQRFVAIGDSFTEGMDDPDDVGAYRGWADRVAEQLAVTDPGLHYANLAVRGRLLTRIVEEQVPAALALRPDLVSLAGGGNDVLRRRLDLAQVAALLHDATVRLRDSGADVVLFTGIDPANRSPAAARLSPRVRAYNEQVRRTARETGALLVDLGAAGPVLDHPAMWSVDRLHLSPEGHHRVAQAVLEQLERPYVADWRVPPPEAVAAAWLIRRRADARWMRVHAAPWVHRRLTGRSSGDLVDPKRPGLSPVRTAPVTDRGA